MSDNPRPQLYGARYTALLANRADEEPDGVFTIAGKHCESGDVLIERAELPEPRRGDLIAVPATGAYTLGDGARTTTASRGPRRCSSAAADARLIRRRETIDDLLELEALGAPRPAPAASSGDPSSTRAPALDLAARRRRRPRSRSRASPSRAHGLRDPLEPAGSATAKTSAVRLELPHRRRRSCPAACRRRGR